MQNRRDFIKNASVFSAMMAAAPAVVSAQGAARTFNVAMIGSGRRASAALENMTEAAKKMGHTVQLLAAHDFFLEEAQRRCKQFGCDEKFAFGGGDGYFKMLDVPAIEIVILGAPPAFRPRHLAACIKAGKHVFAEKPIAVDPQGVRHVLECAAAAKAKQLTLVTGTQRRHQGAYMRQALAFQKGQLGTVRGGNIYWCGGWGSVRPRKPGVTNAQYMANNWMNWAEMSGDHIVEQHVHNIDVANWFIGRYPHMAVAVGARTRRHTGDQYDFFSTDFDYGDGLHIHSLARQIPGCWNRVGELFSTDQAEISGGGKIRRYDGKELQLEDLGNEGNPYVNEHSALLDSVIHGKQLNEGETIAYATAAAIMGRLSAYTGQAVRLSDILKNKESPFYNMNFKPSALDFEGSADIVLPQEENAPRAGKG
ncbi:MAG: Gfo/Idh/MocA family oxidoreductase [Kiritimatiellia bacterium]|jgi:predicted dehydrogenase|nr:Gfo/Idh/MocA family oxidoreductase [Kiritimatiellia bacterium]